MSGTLHCTRPARTALQPLIGPGSGRSYGVRAQRGFAAVAAVFLVLVLAAMGAYMVSISNAQKIESVQDVQGTRAYWAARAGLEWALTAINASSGACPSSPPATVDTGDVFTLAISCTLNSYSEGPNTVKIFSIKSVASKGTVGTLGYVERSVSASVEK